MKHCCHLFPSVGTLRVVYRTTHNTILPPKVHRLVVSCQCWLTLPTPDVRPAQWQFLNRFNISRPMQGQALTATAGEHIHRTVPSLDYFTEDFLGSLEDRFSVSIIVSV